MALNINNQIHNKLILYNTNKKDKTKWNEPTSRCKIKL